MEQLFNSKGVHAQKMSIPVGAIVGPTATGKSKVAVEVAEILNGEIISVDSMQVYIGLDIGTAKIRKEERYSSSGKYIEHHMIDVVTPDVNYNVADFKLQAKRLIEEIHSRGKIPVLVGGTGLYYHAVIREYEFPPGSYDKELRSQLRKEAQKFGSEHLHRKLVSVDPDAAKKIHPNDTKRIIRALEFYYVTGRRISQIKNKVENKYKLAATGLFLERKKLYEAINRRVDKMLEEGLIEEVRSLLNKGYPTSANWAQGLGYKQVIGYLEGQYDLETCAELIKRDTRRYAKRQLTWFKRDKSITWFDVASYPNIGNMAEAIASHIQQRLQIEIN